MLPTPTTTHISFDRVYEPAEDSYLLLDTLSSPNEIFFLSTNFPPRSPSPLITEIGTGSGVVLAFLTAHAETIFKRQDILTLGVDVNEFACVSTTETVKIAAKKEAGSGNYLGNVLGDLTTALKPGSVDVLVFNPPYVPTPAVPALDALRGRKLGKTTFEEDSHLLELSYAGGEDGMETTWPLLDTLPHILSNRGVAYILLCAQNKPEEVKNKIRGWGSNWVVETVGSSGKKAGWEKLVIVRISRS
jgi:release factor glutamine methyltransferase